HYKNGFEGGRNARRICAAAHERGTGSRGVANGDRAAGCRGPFCRNGDGHERWQNRFLGSLWAGGPREESKERTEYAIPNRLDEQNVHRSSGAAIGTKRKSQIDSAGGRVLDGLSEQGCGNQSDDPSLAEIGRASCRE